MNSQCRPEFFKRGWRKWTCQCFIVAKTISHVCWQALFATFLSHADLFAFYLQALVFSLRVALWICGKILIHEKRKSENIRSKERLCLERGKNQFGVVRTLSSIYVQTLKPSHLTTHTTTTPRGINSAPGISSVEENKMFKLEWIFTDFTAGWRGRRGIRYVSDGKMRRHLLRIEISDWGLISKDFY